jgi:hypothetical protein
MSGGPELVEYRLQKGVVGLLADPDRDVVFLELLALRPDVESDDLGVRAEVAAPHLQGATSADADLDERDGTVDEPGEVRLEDREIVGPLVERPAVVADCLCPEAHRAETIPGLGAAGARSRSRPTPNWRSARCRGWPNLYQDSYGGAEGIEPLASTVRLTPRRA